MQTNLRKAGSHIGLPLQIFLCSSLLLFTGCHQDFANPPAKPKAIDAAKIDVAAVDAAVNDGKSSDKAQIDAGKIDSAKHEASGVDAAPADAAPLMMRLDDKPHVIQIDIDDHGLKALWDANAPNLKGLIANGTYGYSRVLIPTHSNQSNFTQLCGAYPDVDNVPNNTWLDRSDMYKDAFDLGGSLVMGDYVYYDKNPLGTRVVSNYQAAQMIGATTAYVGELPPFERTAQNIHFALNGVNLDGVITPTSDLVDAILMTLRYPPDLVSTI